MFTASYVYNFTFSSRYVSFECFIIFHSFEILFDFFVSLLRTFEFFFKYYSIHYYYYFVLFFPTVVFQIFKEVSCVSATLVVFSVSANLNACSWFGFDASEGPGYCAQAGSSTINCRTSPLSVTGL